MKKSYPILPLAAITSLIFASIPAHAAVLLAVDFGTGTSPIQSTFFRQSATPATHSTTEGNITVTLTGIQGFFDRGASAGAANDLYRDFIFQNSGGFTIALSGAGIDPSSAYELTFYSYDSGDAARNTTISASSGTVGTALGPITQATGIPDTMGEYSRTGTFTSSASSTLTFSITGSRTVINGFQLTLVPEPSTALLGGLGVLLLLRRRRA